MFKKFTVLFLTVTMISVTLPFSFHIDTIAAKGINIWNGEVASSFEGGIGTVTDPYLISTGEQLALLAKDVNSGITYSDNYFKMTNDIYLNKPFKEFIEEETVNANEWVPIGGHDLSGGSNYGHYFKGIFDGNNYSVYGVYINETDPNYGGFQGLFGITRNIIKNLSVENAYIVGYATVGGVVAQSYADIINCKFSGRIFANMHVGGIVGTLKTSIYNCVNYGDIQSKLNCGGVIGVHEISKQVGDIYGYKSTGEIKGCYNLGNIYGEEKSGGIVGSIDCGSENVAISECYNSGEISGEEYIGGLIGSLGFHIWGSVIKTRYDISNCFNSGTIIGKYSGCFFGKLSRDSMLLPGSIINCYNVGSIFDHSGNDNSYLPFGENGYQPSFDSNTVCKEFFKNCYQIKGIFLADNLDQLSTYEGWDFENIWEFDYSNGYIYPQLKNLPHISQGKRYFSDEESKLFFSFIFDCSEIDGALIEESNLYKYMTGRLTTAEDEEVARIALLTLIYSGLDSCIEQTEYSLESSESGIMEFLNSKVSDNLEEDVVNEIFKGILKKIENGIGSAVASHLSNVDFYYVIENAGIIENSLKSVGIVEKVKEYTDGIKALTASYIYADSSETLNMYKYFSGYINARKNFDSANDENFSLLMDTYQLVLEDSQSFVPLASLVSGKSFVELVLNFYTGKSSDWTREEYIFLLERWGEFVYQTSELVKAKAELAKNGEVELYTPKFTVNLNGTIAVYYGMSLSTLNIKAEADTNSDIIYKWYINDTESIIGGKMVGSGSYYKPTALSCGIYYLYSIAENRNGYGITDEIYAVSGIKKIIIDHAYSAYVKNPTCLESGYTNYDCNGCTETYVSDYTKALGHNFSSAWTTDMEATCTSLGSKSHHCTRCDIKTDITEIGITEHYSAEWITDKAATLIEEGKRHKNCSNCGSDFSYEITPLRIRGDINEDLDIDSLDVTIARKTLLEMITLSEIDISVANINDDDDFDLKDLVKFKKVLSE